MRKQRTGSVRLCCCKPLPVGIATTNRQVQHCHFYGQRMNF
jgi:hypothetical protein